MPFLFLFFFWDPYNSNVGAFDIVPAVSETILSSFHSFYFICSSEVISTILSSGSLISSSAPDILLLIPSGVFLLSAIVSFFSVCLFFNSPKSLLIYSFIVSMLFPWLLIIFTIIILNSFSGSLPYFLFIYLDFCVSSLFLHLCGISLPSDYFF